MKGIQLICSCLLLLAYSVQAQNPSTSTVDSSKASPDFTLYKKMFLADGTDTLPYRLLLPENYDSSKQYPLIVVLHGAGERGKDNEVQLKHGGALFLKDSVRKSFPARTIFPQCSFFSFWSNVKFDFDMAAKKPKFLFQADGDPSVAMRLAIELVNKTLKDYPIKKDQVYVGGLSMGGMGTFEIVRRMPNTFAAAFPICGGANPSTAKELTQPSWWIFHGEKDPVVPVKFSEEMAEALKRAGAKEVRLSLYPDALHNSWDNAFAEPDFLPWLFSKKMVQ
jgi:predicted peptidase